MFPRKIASHRDENFDNGREILACAKDSMMNESQVNYGTKSRHTWLRENKNPRGAPLNEPRSK